MPAGRFTRLEKRRLCRSANLGNRQSSPNKTDCLPLVDSSLKPLDYFELVSPVQQVEPVKAPKLRRDYRGISIDHLKRRLDFADCEDVPQTRQPKIRRLW